MARHDNLMMRYQRWTSSRIDNGKWIIDSDSFSVINCPLSIIHYFMDWILVLSYWVHLLATIIWVGGIALMALVALPALKRGQLESNQWLQLQKQFSAWANGSFLLLLISGFIQMTADVNYTGLFVLDSTWAWAMLAKHIAFAVMVLLMAYMQFSLYPAMERVKVLAEKRPSLAQSQQEHLSKQESRLLWLNVAVAAMVLFFTAVITAV